MKKNNQARNKRNFYENRWFLWLVFGFFFITGLIFYSNSFDCSFQFDDVNQITRNEKIIDVNNFLQDKYWKNINVRPLSYFSFVFNYRLAGEDVWSYHLINLVIHVITSFLVFLLARLMFRRVYGSDAYSEKRNIRYAIFVGLLFMVHPIQTMAVTYIVQRMTSMAAMFYVLSVYLYALARNKQLDGAKSQACLLLLAGCLVSGVLAILSKQNAVTFPIAILLYELFFVRNKEGKPYRTFIISGFSLVIAAIIIITALGYLPRETAEITRGTYLITQFKVLLRYLQLIVFPIGQNVDHNIELSQSLFGLREIIGLLLTISMIVISVLLFKRKRIISFGIAWFLVTMSVESGTIPIRDVMMEHRLYLPMAGISLLFVDLLFGLCGKERTRFCNYVLVAVIIILGVLTYQRNKVWKTDYTLWKDSLEKTPENTRAMTNYGFALVKQKKYNEAIRYYTKAIDRDTSLTDAYFNRGVALFDMGRYRLAIRDLSVVIDRRKDSEVPYFFRGVSYGHLGRYSEAIADLSKAISLNPDIAVLYKNRGVVYEMMDNYIDALEDFNEAIRLDPGNKRLLVNRSRANFMVRHYQDALDDILEAERAGIAIDPKYVEDIKYRMVTDTLRPKITIRRGDNVQVVDDNE